MQNPEAKIVGSTGPLHPKSFATLRRFVRGRTPKERCEICGVELSADHAHLFEPAHRQLVCACDACALSISQQTGTPYRRVPRRVRFLMDFRLTDAQWDSLLIPVGMAFFFYNSPAERVMAFYPSPAGAMESLLNIASWAEIVRANSILQTLEPDVEALLVDRLQDAQAYYLAPIDKCYELVGLIRMYWRGLSGGSEVWEEIGKFYAKLKSVSNDQ